MDNKPNNPNNKNGNNNNNRRGSLLPLIAVTLALTLGFQWISFYLGSASTQAATV